MLKTLVEVKGLTMVFGDKTALSGISLDLYEDQVTVLLGPNGSGKTTFISCVEGLLSPTQGSVRVFGQNPQRDSEWKNRFGAMLQESKLDSDLTVYETIDKFASYYSNPLPVDQTLQTAGLTEQARQRTHKLSGGQRKRLDFALALVGNPDLLILDEPTAALDQQSRRQMWDVIRAIKDSGAGILLTTHDLQDVQTIFDRIVIIDSGQIRLDEPGERVRNWMKHMLIPESVSLSGSGTVEPIPASQLSPGSMAAQNYVRPSLSDFYDFILGGGNLDQ